MQQATTVIIIATKQHVKEKRVVVVYYYERWADRYNQPEKERQLVTVELIFGIYYFHGKQALPCLYNRMDDKC